MDGGDILGNNLAGDRERGDLIFSTMEKMGYRVATPGEKDLAYGWSYVAGLGTKHHVKWISGNLYDAASQKPLLPAYATYMVGDLKVGVFGLLSPTLTITPTTSEPTPEVHDAIEAAREIVPQLRDKEKCAYVIGLLHMPNSQSAELLKLVPGIDLAVYAHDGGIRQDLEKVEQTEVLRTGDRGQRIGLVDITRTAANEPPTATADVVLLAEGVPSNATLANSLKAADDEIRGRIGLENARLTAEREMQRGDDHFLGDEMCARCHAGYMAQWSETKHAQAFATLETKQSDKDVKCISCHVTGFGTPTGFLDPHASPDLRNVQCESCHGAGTAHGPGYAAAAKNSCTTCHNAEQSPGFDYNSAWKKIQHPPQLSRGGGRVGASG